MYPNRVTYKGRTYRLDHLSGGSAVYSRPVPGQGRTAYVTLTLDMIRKGN